MTDSHADILIHPTRLRILMAVFGRQMTPQQIAAALPDVPQATLYRHINKMGGAGILRVVETKPVRGTVEKVYAVAREGSRLSEEEIAHLSREDHLRYFTNFVGFLLGQFRGYIQQENYDLLKDGVSYRIAPVHLTEEEFTTLVADLRARLEPAMDAPPGEDRRRRLISFIILPDMSAPEENSATGK